MIRWMFVRGQRVWTTLVSRPITQLRPLPSLHTSATLRRALHLASQSASIRTASPARDISRSSTRLYSSAVDPPTPPPPTSVENVSERTEPASRTSTPTRRLSDYRPQGGTKSATKGAAAGFVSLPAPGASVADHVRANRAGILKTKSTAFFSQLYDVYGRSRDRGETDREEVWAECRTWVKTRGIEAKPALALFILRIADSQPELSLEDVQLTTGLYHRCYPPSLGDYISKDRTAALVRCLGALSRYTPGAPLVASPDSSRIQAPTTTAALREFFKLLEPCLDELATPGRLSLEPTQVSRIMLPLMNLTESIPFVERIYSSFAIATPSSFQSRRRKNLTIDIVQRLQKLADDQAVALDPDLITRLVDDIHPVAEDWTINNVINSLCLQWARFINTSMDRPKAQAEILEKAVQVHSWIRAYPHQSTLNVRPMASLLNAYNLAGAHDKVKELWEEMRTSVGYNPRACSIMFDSCGFAKDPDFARREFATLRASHPELLNLNAWSAYQECLARCDLWTEALDSLCIDQRAATLDQTVGRPTPESLSLVLNKLKADAIIAMSNGKPIPNGLKSGPRRIQEAYPQWWERVKALHIRFDQEGILPESAKDLKGYAHED